LSADSRLQELHKPIDIEIVRQLLSVIPEGWWSIRLEIGYVRLPDDEEGFPMTISNTDGAHEIVMPPDALYELVCQHADVFKEHGTPWRQLTYNVTFDEQQENWNYTIDYAY